MPHPTVSNGFWKKMKVQADQLTRIAYSTVYTEYYCIYRRVDGGRNSLNLLAIKLKARAVVGRRGGGN